MRVIKPPAPLKIDEEPIVFCSGSIEGGDARDWQAVVEEAFRDKPGTLLSPRRVKWDSTWLQDPSFEPFRQQVQWELDAIDKSEIVLVHFEPTTKSPITLLELGYLIGKKKKIIVSCSRDFWRWGNVAIICQRSGVEVHNNLEDALFELDNHLRKVIEGSERS